MPSLQDAPSQDDAVIPLTTSDALEKFLKALGPSCGHVAVDTEFIRETTYWPHLCLVQVASATQGAVIDVLSPDLDVSLLWTFLKNPKILKVFHAARQDLEGLGRAMGQLPLPLFDTQLAAMACGLGDSVSYENLVQQLLGQKLDKSQRVIDWSKRPLTPAQLAYALNDVVPLERLYPLLSRRLKEWNREAWIGEEKKALITPKTYLPDLEGAWKKVKGWATIKGLTRESFCFLQRLATWREEEASSTNRPRRFVLRDEALCDGVIAFQKNASPPPPLSASSPLTDIFQTLAQEVRSMAPELWPPLVHLQGPGEEEKMLYKALSTLLQNSALKAAVAPRLIGTRHDLEGLIRAAQSQDVEEGGHILVTGWRYDVFGAQALETLSRLMSQRE